MQSTEDKLSLQLETKQLGVRLPIPIVHRSSAPNTPILSGCWGLRFLEGFGRYLQPEPDLAAGALQELQESRNELLNRVQSLKKVRASPPRL